MFRFLLVPLILALTSQGNALDLGEFMADLNARKGFDLALLNLTVDEAGYMLGSIIASSGKSCEARPTRWMVRGKDSKGNTLLTVHCEKKSTDFLLAVPLDPDAKSTVSFCAEIEKLTGVPCWGPLD